MYAIAGKDAGAPSAMSERPSSSSAQAGISAGMFERLVAKGVNESAAGRATRRENAPAPRRGGLVLARGAGERSEPKPR